MTSTLTKKVMREWRNLSCLPTNETKPYYLRPQDSNVCIWHLLLVEPNTSMEIYIQLYISDSNKIDRALHEESTVIIRCLTPNNLLPINRNISLSHLSNIIVQEGIHTFIMNLWNTFFTETISYEPANGTKIINASTSRIWNRIICKNFKYYFPELIGCLQSGDYRTIRTYSKWLKTEHPSYCGLYPKNNNSINTDTFQNLIYQHSIDNHNNNIIASTNNCYLPNDEFLCDTNNHKNSNMCNPFHTNKNSYPFDQQQMRAFHRQIDDMEISDLDEIEYEYPIRRRSSASSRSPVLIKRRRKL